MAVGIFVGYRLLTPDPVLTAATVLPQPMPLPSFELVSTAGQRVGPEAFRGRWDLVFFGFTHCPDICPLTLQKLTAAHRRLADAQHRPLPRIVFISVDPERDTPDTVADYVAHFGSDVLGITGLLPELRKLTDALGIYFQKVDTGNGGYTVDHSAVVLVIDPAGRFHAVFGSPHDVATFAREIPLIQAAG